MHNITAQRGTLSIIERLDNSACGNPRFLISIGDTQCKTGIDSMHGYSVTNFEGKRVRATIGTHYNTPTLESIVCFNDDQLTQTTKV